MDRRNFLRSLVGGVAASAAVRTFPFRVFSFPTDIVIAPPMNRMQFVPLLAPGLRNLFIDFTSIQQLIDEQDEALLVS
jgi:hypothetical protein